jgi:hypothetical protein
MTLYLPLLYFVWNEECCQTSPNKNKSPNLWHITSILVCCIFGYHQTSESVCCWLVVLEIIKKDAFLSILSLKKTMAGEESWQGCRVLISFTAENRVGSQSRHGKFDPDKVQYSTRNFFWPVVSYNCISWVNNGWRHQFGLRLLLFSLNKHSAAQFVV